MANVIVRRSNRTGIPLIEAQGITTNATNTVITFNNHVNLNDNFIGGFWVKFPQVVATGTLPVVFSTLGANSNVPVYDASGAALTAAGLVSTEAPTYHLFFYDRVSNRTQLIA